MKKKSIITAVFFFSASITVFSQSLSVNTDGSIANASAMLDVKSIAKGILIPRMTRAERNAVSSPATGLLIFQNGPDSIGFYYYNGSNWTWILSNSNADSLAWRTGGNLATTDAANFIGTKDNIPFNIRVNDQKAGRIDNTLANTFWGYQAGNANSTGSSNTANGYRALYNNTTGSRNTAVGDSALYSNTTRSNLVAVGNQALFSNSTGSSITAIGDSALYSNTTGNLNSAFGYGALRKNIGGINNTAVGFHALYFNTSGINNNAIGVETMYNNTTGSNNTAYGFGAMYGNTGGSDNTGLGFYALLNNSTGIDNTAVGREALYGSTIFTGNSNVGVGKLSGRNTITGSDNTFVGSYTAQQNTTGSSNVSIGRSAIFQNTTGSSNTVAGYFAMTNNTTGYSNVAIGVKSLYSNTTSNNLVAIGDSSLYNSTGTGNTAIGSKAAYSLTTGINNVFLGYQAGYSETTGSNKLYIANSSSNPPLIYGDFSAATVGLGTITPAEKLEINGNLKFTIASTIYSNTGTALTVRPGDGTGSGGALTIRGGNAGIGSGGAGGDLNLVAGANLPAGGAGYGNLGVPGVLNITGSYGYNSVGGVINITAGATSCWSLVSGSHSDVNIKGGQNLATTDAGSITVQGGYTIGTSCPPPGATGGNIIIQSGLGSGTGLNGTIQLMNGNVGIGTAIPSQKLHVVGNICYTGGIAACSDSRYKTKISPLQNSLSKLMQLEGVNYFWKTSEYSNMNFTDRLQVGFIAQDLEKIFPEMVFTDDKGYKSIDYSRLTPVLVETIKEQQKQIADMNTRLHEIEKILIK